MRTDRRVITWLLPAALLTCGPAVARHEPEAIELSARDDGETYRVLVGTEFEVRLSREVGDYWQWEMRDDPRFIAVDPPYRNGYGNKRGDREDLVFRVRVTQPGRFPLVFEKLSTFGGRKRSLAQRVTYLIEAGAPEGRGPPPGMIDRPSVADGPDVAFPPLGEKDAGRVIHVPAGREITILLPFASRLDQRWEVFGSRNIGLAAPIVERADPGRKKNIFWLDSNNVIRLRPSGRGDAEVTFAYLPREHGSTTVRQLRYRFMVD